MPEESPNADLVELPGEWKWKVPRDFAVKVVSTTGDGMEFAVDISMVAGRPHVNVLIISSPKGRPLTVEQLVNHDLRGVVDAAVQYAAFRNTPAPEWTVEQLDRMETAEGFADLIDEAWLSSRHAAVRARRRRVTPELLEEVLRLNEEGGIRMVMEKLGYQERNARRLLARAQGRTTT